MVASRSKIGIRPTIDGRMGGVRESLESQTMSMATRVAELISSEVFLRDGSAAQCVIADTCIGGVAEAAACEEKFAREGVAVSLTVTPCWCYGSETMDMNRLRPKAVWGFNGTERPGAVYLAAALACHTQKGLPAFGIYGRDVQDSDDTAIPDDVSSKILRFIRAALAVAQMHGKSYVSIGGTSMGIGGSMVDTDFFEKYLGMRVETIDMTEIARREMKDIFDPDEFARAAIWVKTNCTEGPDANEGDSKRNRKQLDQEWEFSIKMALIAKDLIDGNPRLAELGFPEEALGRNGIAGGFQGQRQWTDTYPNGDFMEAILTSSFDWNGRRSPYMFGTENDALNAVTMLFGNLLTNTAQIFADLRTYWSYDAVQRVTGHELTGHASNGLLHLINSGPASLDGTGKQRLSGRPAMKPFWEISDDEVTACLAATTWHPSITEYFPGGGWSTRFTTEGGMPATIARLNLVDGLGPALQLAEGFTVELPSDVHDTLDQRTNPTWPTTWFAPRTNSNEAFRESYSVMNHWGSNHCMMSYGHIGADLLTLASMLRIPVYMHNVDSETIFRPSAWAAFGTADPEAGDYRACLNYGPLYG